MFGGLPDPRDVSAGRAADVDLVCRRARVVEDDAEQVVEVVRNARGESAEAFEPTRLVQLGLQPVASELGLVLMACELGRAQGSVGMHALGDVTRADDDSVHGRIIEQIVGAHLEGSVRAVLVEHARIERPDQPGAVAGARELGDGTRRVIRMDVVEDARSEAVFRMPPEDPQCGRTQVGHLPFGIDHTDEVREIRQHRLESACVADRLVLRAAEIGDVAQVADDAADDRIVDPIGRDELEDPPAAVGVRDPQLDRGDALVAEKPLCERVAHGDAVVGVHEVHERRAEV